LGRQIILKVWEQVNQRPKQNRESWLFIPVPEGGEPWLLIAIIDIANTLIYEIIYFNSYLKSTVVKI
jgi:hypothetical protein